MKDYSRTISTVVTTSIELKESIKAARKNLHLLYGCSSMDDIMSIQNQFQLINISYRLNSMVESYGETFEDALESLIEDVENILLYYKQKYKEVNQLEPKMIDAINGISSILQEEGYAVTCISNTQIYVYPDSCNYNELDKLAKRVCEIICAKPLRLPLKDYQIILNLRSNEGVPINIGWSDNRENKPWAPRNSIFIEAVYYN